MSKQELSSSPEASSNPSPDASPDAKLDERN